MRTTCGLGSGIIGRRPPSLLGTISVTDYSIGCRLPLQQRRHGWRHSLEGTMTLHNLFRTMKTWPMPVLAAVVLALSPITASAGTLTATATITPTANSNGTTHYAIALTATGSDTIETMWFGWIPGSFCLTAQPMNVTMPSGWTGDVTPLGGDFAIEWFTGSNAVKVGQTLTGFGFDSAETPAQISQQCAQLCGIPALTAVVYDNDAGASFTIPSGDSQDIVAKL